MQSSVQQAARDALIDLWAEEGFTVDPRKNETFRQLWIFSQLPDEIRKRMGIVSDHEAAWRLKHGR